MLKSWITRPHGTGYMIKQKPPEGGMGILLDGKQGNIIEIFCAEYTADLTRDRIGSIVKGLRHTAGILRGHQVLHHVADGSAHRKLVFGDGELLRGPAFHPTLSQTKAPLGAVHNAATQQGLAWYCDYQLIDRLS